MEIMRLIVTGAKDTEKSSLIGSVSEIKVLEVSRRVPEGTSLIKEKASIPLEYGRLNFCPNLAIHLYGPSVQIRFNFIWGLLINRSHACIVLVAANQPRDFHQTNRLLAFIKARVQIPILIGITHTDCPGAWSPEDVAIALGYANPKKRPMIVTVNPTQSASVLEALMTLVEEFKSKRTASGLERLKAA